jgi:hypothetical protein
VICNHRLLTLFKESLMKWAKTRLLVCLGSIIVLTALASIPSLADDCNMLYPSELKPCDPTGSYTCTGAVDRAHCTNWKLVLDIPTGCAGPSQPTDHCVVVNTAGIPVVVPCSRFNACYWNDSIGLCTPYFIFNLDTPYNGMMAVKSKCAIKQARDE